MKRLFLGVAVVVVPPILACGGGTPEAPTPVPPIPVEPEAAVVQAPAPVVPAPRPAPWADLRAADPFAALAARCASFDASGTLSAYADAPHLFVQKSEGTWRRDGDRLVLAWTETTTSYVEVPEGEGDEEGKGWVESEPKQFTATLALHAAWERGPEDEVEAVILATAVDPACTECEALIRCTGYADHTGGENGDAWFGPPVPASTWAQVIDAGGGAAAVDEVGAVTAPHVGFVFPGDPAKTPRTGIEVLHRGGPQATKAAADIATALGALSTSVRAVPWPEAPHPIVVAVGPLDRWNPE